MHRGQKKEKTIDVNCFGAHIAVDESNDIRMENGRTVLVRGIDGAIQRLSTTLGTQLGELEFDKGAGSRLSQYYHAYKNDLPLLSALLELEIIRLSLISTEKIYSKVATPPFGFIKRVRRVEIVFTELINDRIRARIELEWGGGQAWSGTVPIFIAKPRSRGGFQGY